MRSTCKYGLRSISWQSQGDRTLKVRCKHVKLTCHLRNVRCTQLLTARRGARATYLDLAQSYGRRALTYSVPAIATPSPRFQKNVADVASARNVRTKNTHGGVGLGLKASLTTRRACLEIVRTRSSCQAWSCRRVKIKSEGKYVLR